MAATAATANAATVVNADPMADTVDIIAAYNERVRAQAAEELAAWERREAAEAVDRAARHAVESARIAREQHREAVGATGVIAGHLRSPAVVAWAHGNDHPGGPGDADLIALADALDVWAAEPTGSNPLYNAAMDGATAYDPNQSAARRALHAATDPHGGGHRLRAAEAARGIRAIVLDAAAGRNAHRWDRAGTVEAMNAELPAVLGRPATVEDMAVYRTRLAARNGTRLPLTRLLEGLPL